LGRGQEETDRFLHCGGNRGAHLGRRDGASYDGGYRCQIGVGTKQVADGDSSRDNAGPEAADLLNTCVNATVTQPWFFSKIQIRHFELSYIYRFDKNVAFLMESFQ